MNPGDLRHRVVFQSKSVTRNNIGEQVVTWVPYATRWARVKPLRGRELFAAQQTHSTVDTKIVLRFDSTTSAITADMRVVWRGENYDVLSAVDQDGGRYYMEILAVHGVKDGR